MLYKVVLTFDPVDEILKCHHSNESYGVVFSCGSVYYAVRLILHQSGYKLTISVMLVHYSFEITIHTFF